MNIAMTPPFSSRWEEVLFWVAVIVGFVVPFIYFVRWSLKNAASTKDEVAQRCINPDEFRPHPYGRVCDLAGIRRGRAASTLAPLSRTDNVPSRAGSHSVGLSHIGAFLFP